VNGLNQRPVDLGIDVGSRRPGLAVFAAFNALTAWFGAIGLTTGLIDLGGRLEQRLPFDSPVVAGVALAGSVAAPLTLLAWSAWRAWPSTGRIALASGTLLIGWIVLQVVVLRSFSYFQPAYLAIGVGFVVASHRVQTGRRRQGAMAVVLGAIFVGIGVGLVPHLLGGGALLEAIAAVGALVAGLTLVCLGASMMLRGRRWFAHVAGGVVVLVATALVTSMVAPAVAATHARRGEVGNTPASMGLAYDDVTLVTSDDVEVAAWYLAGTNGAGLVVRHGAGSTRSDVLDQAAALLAAGYSVLVMDARGHGDSAGTAMDFGWFGDLDVAAGTAFLASRPEVDGDRIGAVGFSMGGEEVIGAAAAADVRLAAVVAEGATGRSAADKRWLSDVYGWRGWVQARLESVQDGLTEYLASASRPISLRSAVASATDTSFLLITAGDVADELHAATFIRAGATERVTLWTVEGADHTAGFDTNPDEWQGRVVSFLDAHLSRRGVSGRGASQVHTPIRVRTTRRT
jgi:pimeloyl-ACP methyl ester carboxylesterase